MIKRFGLLAIMLVGMAVFFYFDLGQYLTFSALKVHRHQLLEFVQANMLLAVLIYMGLYIIVVALSLPGGAVMTITGGFLFGSVLGTVQVVIAATVGATILFLTARLALGDTLKKKAGPWLKKLESGFNEDALNYILVLRLVPLFPFFVVNLVPAFLNVGTRVYILGTFIGIIPGTFVYASIGSGIGSVFEAGNEFSAKGLLTPDIVIALVGLGVLSLLPVLYKKVKAKK